MWGLKTKPHPVSSVMSLDDPEIEWEESPYLTWTSVMAFLMDSGY